MPNTVLSLAPFDPESDVRAGEHDGRINGLRWTKNLRADTHAPTATTAGPEQRRRRASEYLSLPFFTRFNGFFDLDEASSSRRQGTYRDLNLRFSGPRGDRTHDTVIKSHVLYH